MTTRPDIAAILARLATTTPGVWTLEPYGDDGELGAGDLYAHESTVLIANDVMGSDAAFIVAAHNTDVADLLAHTRTLEALVREYYDSDAVQQQYTEVNGRPVCAYCHRIATQDALGFLRIPHTADCLRTRTAAALGLEGG